MPRDCATVSSTGAHASSKSTHTAKADVVTDTNVGMVPDEFIIDLDPFVVEGRRAIADADHGENDTSLILCTRRVRGLKRNGQAATQPQQRVGLAAPMNLVQGAAEAA